MCPNCHENVMIFVPFFWHFLSKHNDHLEWWSRMTLWSSLLRGKVCFDGSSACIIDNQSNDSSHESFFVIFSCGKPTTLVEISCVLLSFLDLTHGDGRGLSRWVNFFFVIMPYAAFPFICMPRKKAIHLGVQKWLTLRGVWPWGNQIRSLGVHKPILED